MREARVHAIVGGLHLGAASAERLQETAAALVERAPDLVIPCHCTGSGAVARLREALGERVQPGAAGATYSFGALAAAPVTRPPGPRSS